MRTGLVRVLIVSSVMAAACGTFAFAGDASPMKTLEWTGKEHRITADTTYKDVTIIARCSVIVKEGCTLTLENVRMLIEQRVSKEEEEQNRILGFKNRRRIKVEGKLVARRWRLDEITGKNDIPHEIGIWVYGEAELNDCTLGSRVNFFPAGNGRCSTVINSSIGGIVKAQQTSRNFFKNCKLSSRTPNRYVESQHKSVNTFEECQFLCTMMDMFAQSTNVFRCCVLANDFWVRGKTSNSFEKCIFPGRAIFKGNSRNEFKQCRFTGGIVGLSERAKLVFASPASNVANVVIYKVPKMRIPCNPQIRGNLSLAVKRFDEGTQVTRFFPLAVKDAAGNPAPGTKVHVVDNKGKTIAEGTTDKDGLVELHVSFNAGNYKKGNFWLAVNREKMRRLSLLDSTTEPISLKLP